MELDQRTAGNSRLFPNKNNIGVPDTASVLQPPPYCQLVPVVLNGIATSHLIQPLGELFEKTGGRHLLAAAPLGSDQTDGEGSDGGRPTEFVLKRQDFRGSGYS
jgi:hypothetical protein